MYDANVVIAAFLMGMSFTGLLFAISEHLALRDAQREQYRKSHESQNGADEDASSM